MVATHRDEAAGAETLQVLITTSELVAGENRFAFGLLKNDTLLEGARVIVRIYDLSPEPPRLYAETPAPYHKLEVVEQNQRVHIHPDGTRHVHDSATDVLGVYVAQVRFPRPGPWGIEVLARQGDGTVEAARFTVEALAAGHAPMPGTPAPRSRNLVVTDVADLRTLDSSDPPDPRLHQHRIADAIIQGKPQVIVFATPKYCTSRVCGPVVDVVRTLIPAYGDRVVFIHQEIYNNNNASDGLRPQVLAYAMERLLAEGALDVFSVPVQMKKSRPGALLTVLTKMEDADRLTKTIFAETTTLGVRNNDRRSPDAGKQWIRPGVRCASRSRT